MAVAKKAQQNVFPLYHLYNPNNSPGVHMDLDFHFKILLVLRWRYLIPMRCFNGKRKIWPCWWLHQFEFQHWRWLHSLMAMVASVPARNFFLYTADPMQTNMHIDCMIVIKCDACKIFGAYALLDYIMTRIEGNAGNKHSMQVTHIKNNAYFNYFIPT